LKQAKENTRNTATNHKQESPAVAREDALQPIGLQFALQY